MDQSPVEVTEQTAAQRYLNSLKPEAVKEAPKEPEAKTEEGPEDIEDNLPDVEGDEFDIDGDETDSDEDLYEVKVNGEVFKVTLQELTAGYQKDRDYQQKTQALAKERETVKREREVLSSLNSRLERLDGTVAYLEDTKALLQAAAPVVDQRLIETNPAMYIRMKEAREAYLNKVSEIDARIGQARSEAEESLREARRIGALTIQQKMPELTTPEGAQKLYSYLIETYGYKTENIDANADANLFIIAEKARRYDDIMSRPRKPTPQAAKIARSKTAPRPAGDPRANQVNSVRSQYKENPTERNAAALYLANKGK